jgi:DNA-binding LacI/PurR family transcriptional regulator
VATIRDVAKLAGVSASTASRILSNNAIEKYPAETREKVLKASHELGYRPNSIAYALTSGKTRIIAGVFPQFYGQLFTEFSLLEMMSGIEAVCNDYGYHMLIASSSMPKGVDPNLINLMDGGYLDGVIINGLFDITPIMEHLLNLQIPTVVLGHYPHEFSVRSDNAEGGQLLMEHLIELGHQQVGILSVPGITTRIDGIRRAADKHGLDFYAFPQYQADFTEESGARGAEYLVQNHPDLTAIIAISDLMAIGAINRLRELGYRVPEDISVIGYDDLPLSRSFYPPLTTINQELYKWGSLAMGMLLEVMNGSRPAPIKLTPKLVVRKSTATPRSRV